VPTDRATDLVERLTKALLDRPEVLDAYLFGSQARGDATRRSDVDVAVWIDPRAEGESPYGPAAVLTAVLMSALGRNDVDVVVLNRAPPLLYHRVLRDGIRLVSRDPLRTTEREARAMSRWCDWEPQQRRIDALLAASFRAGAPRR
jgi:hypothetical protein